MLYYRIISILSLIPSFTSLPLHDAQYRESKPLDFNKLELPQNPVCRDEITGQPLDWFTLYKLPKNTTIIEKSRIDSPYISAGTAYTYMTNLSQNKWSMSSLSMNETNSLAGRTLDVLYKTSFGRQKSKQKTNNNIGYILYNDQADEVSFTRGHTKGIIIFNDETAIWVVHSIPHFPPKPSELNYQIHSSQCLYGQHFFCMSLQFSELEKIGQQMLYTYPQVYDSFIPEFAKQEPYFQNILKVLNSEHVEMAPWSNLNYFTTSGGEKLLSFAKYTNFEDDLYTALVASTLKSDLYTETWNNGAGTLITNCSFKYQVHNVEKIKFDSFGIEFSVLQDHTKWAVTAGERVNNFRLNVTTKEIVCIGDINRQVDQLSRAGGTVCFLENRNVSEQFAKIVYQVEPCPERKNKTR